MLRQRPGTPLIVLFVAAGAAAIVVIIVFIVRGGGPVGPLISCFDFAEEQTGAATSPHCAPFILPDGEAERLLGTMDVTRLGSGYYVVGDEDSWAAISKADIWRTLSAVVSAVQAVHGVDGDVSFIVTPASREESAQLLQGELPDERIVASAEFEKRATKKIRTGDVPPSHFERSYRLRVR